MHATYIAAAAVRTKNFLFNFFSRIEAMRLKQIKHL